jgi:hypothetical protein
VSQRCRCARQRAGGLTAAQICSRSDGHAFAQRDWAMPPACHPRETSRTITPLMPRAKNVKLPAISTEKCSAVSLRRSCPLATQASDHYSSRAVIGACKAFDAETDRMTPSRAHPASPTSIRIAVVPVVMNVMVITMALVTVELFEIDFV